MKARNNPFRTERLEALPFRFPEGSWPLLWARLERCNRRAAVVGPCGSGKTTLLDELARRFPERGLKPRRLRAPTAGDPAPGFWDDLASVAPTDAVLIDESDALSFWRWRRLQRAARLAGALVVTRRRSGRLPTLLNTRTSPTLLAGLVSELLHGAPPPADLAAVFTDCGGDLRRALLTLYDRWSPLNP